ncbi:MAG: DMT family transporter [Spirochaetota bacterium]
MNNNIRDMAIASKLPVNPKLIGIISLIIATLGFTSSQIFIKYSAVEVDPFHIAFWRCLIGLIIVFAMAVKNKRLTAPFREMDKSRIKWLIIRSLVGTGAVYTVYLALSLPNSNLGELGTIVNINPVITVILSWLILKEKLDIKVWFTLILALSGVFMVENPFTKTGFTLSHIMMLIAAFFISMEIISTRKLNILGVDKWLIIASFLSLALLIAIPKLIIDMKIYTFNTFISLVLVGILDIIGHFSITTSSKYLKARTVGIISLITVFESMILGVLIFDEIVTCIKFVGACLIIVASSMAIILSIRRKRT